jgi:hypothetical protein
VLLLQNLLAENGDEEEEQQKEDVEDVRVVMRAFDDALFIVDNIVFGCENAFVVLIRCVRIYETVSLNLFFCAEKFFVTTSFASLSEHEDEKGCT